MKEKTLLISHIDLDGLGSYILSSYFDLPFMNIHFANYSDYEDGSFPYEELEKHEEVWYFDFTPDLKSQKILEDNNITVIIGDHHIEVKPEIDAWNYKNKTYIFDNDKSGTKIFYEYIKSYFSLPKNKVVEEFVELVNTYDLYSKQSPLWCKAQDLNRLLYKTASYFKPMPTKYEIFIASCIHKFTCLESFDFNKIEQKKINEDKKKETEMFLEFVHGKRKIKTRKDDKGRYFSIIKLDSKISAICNLLLEKYKKLDYIIALNDYDPNSLKVSIRSKEHINILEYCNVKGHENAAGMTEVTEDFFNDLWTGKIYALTPKENSDIIKEQA